MSHDAIDWAARCAPQFPKGYSPGVGIIGCGAIVREHHLPAYEKYDVRVVGAFDIDPTAVDKAAEKHDIGHRYPNLEDILADPAVEVVDVATHPFVRVGLIQQALAAGKHVLSQKPFAPDLESARSLVEEAERRGLKLAVNQNGRWAPAWRLATLLIDDGVIGEPLAVTHIHDEDNEWLIGDNFDKVNHFVVYDFSIHFLDITRCWLGDKVPSTMRAREYRPPGQPDLATAKEDWSALIDLAYEDGTSVVIRALGRTADGVKPVFPFYVHGTEGTLRGDTVGTAVTVDRADGSVSYEAAGHWFPDGLGGTIGELFSAIAEDRQPSNSGRHNLRSLAMAFAAIESAENDGAPVAVEPA